MMVQQGRQSRPEAFLYLARNGNMAKIGVTRRGDPNDRIGDFVPRTRLLRAEPMSWVDAVNAEKNLLEDVRHLRLAHARKITEWFMWVGDDDSLIAYVFRREGTAPEGPRPKDGQMSAESVARFLSLPVGEVLASIRADLWVIDADGFCWVNTDAFVGWYQSLMSLCPDSKVTKKTARTDAKMHRGIHEQSWKKPKPRRVVGVFRMKATRDE